MFHVEKFFFSLDLDMARGAGMGRAVLLGLCCSIATSVAAEWFFRADRSANGVAMKG